MLEVATVIVIVAILAVIAIPVYSKLRSRAERLQCMSNLRNLHLAANVYVQQNEHWPPIRLAGGDDASAREYASQWIDTLAPLGTTRKTWICPTIEHLVKERGSSAPADTRTDYFAMTFDDKPGTPHRWPKQPWFVERADVHGNGNLMILTDGSVTDVKSLVANGAK